MSFCAFITHPTSLTITKTTRHTSLATRDEKPTPSAQSPGARASLLLTLALSPLPPLPPPEPVRKLNEAERGLRQLHSSTSASASATRRQAQPSLATAAASLCFSSRAGNLLPTQRESATQRNQWASLDCPRHHHACVRQEILPTDAQSPGSQPWSCSRAILSLKALEAPKK
ncbi:hypothetical protein SCUP234_13301, partial [Seiridium cupressi]